MKRARSLKVWIAAHVGSDGKIRPCLDNHASLRPIKAFACSAGLCGGKRSVILRGTVIASARSVRAVTLQSLQREAVIGALR